METLERIQKELWDRECYCWEFQTHFVVGGLCLDGWLAGWLAGCLTDRLFVYLLSRHGIAEHDHLPVQSWVRNLAM